MKPVNRIGPRFYPNGIEQYNRGPKSSSGMREHPPAVAPEDIDRMRPQFRVEHVQKKSRAYFAIICAGVGFLAGAGGASLIHGDREAKQQEHTEHLHRKISNLIDEKEALEREMRLKEIEERRP